MDKDSSGTIKLLKDILTIVIASACGAVGIYIFTKSAHFAPVGGDGIAQMLSEVTPISFYYWQLIINIPLIILGFIFLKKKYIFYTLGYILLSSLFIFIFDITKCPTIECENDTGLRLLCAVFAGICLGFRTGLMLRIDGSSGGMDIPSSIYVKKNPGKSAEIVIGILSLLVAACSYFLYHDFIAILLSVIEMVGLMLFSGIAQRQSLGVLEFKIVTKNPEDVRKLVINKFRHGVTIVDSQGGFTKNKEVIMFTVIRRRELSNFLTELGKIPHTFAYYSDVDGVSGNFRYRKEDKAK